MTVPAGTERLAQIIGPVADRFDAAGFRLYLVGGVVRDLALAADSIVDQTSGEPSSPHAGAPSGDIDLTTDAGPREIKKLVSPLAEALWTQGERFGTIGATVNGQPLEITTHRAEAYDPDSRKPMVTFGEDIGEDLSRRDFTINAAAIELPALVLHDPYNGLEDLRSRSLRTPLSPEVSFTDDPLRMMRAARFISRFDLTPTPDVTKAATELADRLTIVSVERVTDEFERLLAVSNPGPGLLFLQSTGLLSYIFEPFSTVEPEVQAEAVELGANVSETEPFDVLVRRAGILWPIRQSAKTELIRLRYSKADTAATVNLLEAVTTVVARPVDEAMVRRLISRLGHDGFARVVSLTTAVTNGDPVRPATQLVTVKGQLEASEDLDDLGSPLSGSEIMATLGIEPGRMIGRATKFLQDYRLDVGPLSKEEGAALVLAWWQETGADGKP